jgi:hypothetical protein
VTGRRRRRRRKLPNDLKERRGYSHLKEELERILKDSIMVQPCDYSNISVKELSKTSRYQSGHEPGTSLKPPHHPTLSALSVLPHGFNFVLQNVIYRSDVLDIFLFPLSAFVSLSPLLTQGLANSVCNIVIPHYAAHSYQIADTFIRCHTALGDRSMINGNEEPT